MNVLPRTSTAMEQWNKRTYEDDIALSPPLSKRPRRWFHWRLESESSLASEDEESILTLQGQETELAKDPSDTDTRSENSSYMFEFEVASLSESDGPLEGYLSTSSGCSNDDAPAVVIEDVVAVVLGDSSLEAWAYDTEYSSTDEQDDSNVRKPDFSACTGCKGQNDVPRFPLCTKCFQVRKKFFPPRPRRVRKQRTHASAASRPSTSAPSVNIEELKSCLDGMSQDSCSAPSTQDSGLGSSQELPLLQLDKIVIPEAAIEETRKRRRSQDSDEHLKPKATRLEGPEVTDKEPPSSLSGSEKLCIICNEQSVNSGFVHGSSAHTCCCYKCAMQCWKTNKRCPICNRMVKSVVKLFMT